MNVMQETRRTSHRRVVEEQGFAAQEWRALGTSAHLVVTSPERLECARRAVDEVLQQIDLAASRFREDSEISALNRSGHEWLPISGLLTRALRVAIDAADWTGGLVDPTVAPP